LDIGQAEDMNAMSMNHMEDRLLIQTNADGKNNATLLCVFDGHGGH
jgi:serine/threonine protein phosphatase PrpC